MTLRYFIHYITTVSIIDKLRQIPRPVLNSTKEHLQAWLFDMSCGRLVLIFPMLVLCIQGWLSSRCVIYRPGKMLKQTENSFTMLTLVRWISGVYFSVPLLLGFHYVYVFAFVNLTAHASFSVNMNVFADAFSWRVHQYIRMENMRAAGRVFEINEPGALFCIPTSHDLNSLGFTAGPIHFRIVVCCRTA